MVSEGSRKPGFVRKVKIWENKIGDKAPISRLATLSGLLARYCPGETTSVSLRT